MSTDATRASYGHEDLSLADAVVSFTRVEPTPDLCVLEVRGDLDIAISAVLSRELDELLELGHPRVAVDLSGVSFMDSSALSALVQAHERAKETGRTLQVVRPSPACAKVLSITGLDRVLGVG
jgi:anti-sigma B factor antagonist